MTKELNFLEINLARVVPEIALLETVSHLLHLNRAAMWNWDWPTEAPELIQTNVSYVVDGEPTYPLFLSLNFNRPVTVPLGFEVEMGYALAQQFDCAVLVNDPTDAADGLLKVQPTGQVVACVLSENAQGLPSYRPAAGLTGPYQQVIKQLQAYIV